MTHFTRIKNDINGNPRFVCHFLEFINDKDHEQAGSGLDSVQKLYELALVNAYKLGGRKFHNKQYGGGIVFQSYNTRELSDMIEKVRNK